MGKEVLSRRQAISLISLFLIGDTLIFAVASAANKNFWLAIILSLIFTIPILFILIYLHNSFPNNSLIEINEILFGKLFGKALNLFFLIYIIQDVLSVLRSFGEFVVTVGFPETPMVVPMIFIILLSIWAAKEGIEVLGRYSQYFLVTLIIFVVLACVLLIPNMSINNIRPIYYIEPIPLVQGTLSTFAFTFGEVIIISMVFKRSTIRDFKRNVYFMGTFITAFVLLISSMTEVLVIGVKAYSTSYFPSYETVSRISIGDFLQSLEIIVAITFILATFLKIAFCIFVSSKVVASVFNFKNYRFLAAPVGLLVLNLSLIAYKDLMHLFQWAEKYWTYFSLPFELFLPIIIFIVAYVKKKKPKDQPAK